jgi:LPS sulfotransferase NodH
MAQSVVCNPAKSQGTSQKPRSKAPVFVVGCPRSGTTLLYHMLLSAGNFAIYRAESQVFNLLEPRFGDLRVEENRCAMLSAWLNSPLFTKTGLDPQDITDDLVRGCRHGGDFLRRVMEAIARKQGVKRWADCTPEHLLFLGRIKQTIPEALIVHVVRDGRDVAVSLEQQRWIQPLPLHHSKSLEVAAMYWNWMVRVGRRAGRRLGQDYFEVRYEKLVHEPRQSLSRLSDFVGQELDYDQIQQVGIGCVRRPNTSFAPELHSGEFKPVARWKQYLSPEQQDVLEMLVGDTRDELGYRTRESHRNPRVSDSLRQMRLLYNSYFATKLFLKTRTFLGRKLASPDLSWT